MEYDEIKCKSFLFSIEEEKEKTKKGDGDEKKFKAENLKNKSVFDKLKEIPNKASILNKRFRLWARKRKNLSFYKKYLDRVKAGLYDRYGQSAEVIENKMLDDPVVILSDTAKDYIKNIVSDINILYKEILNIGKKLENETTAKGSISIVNSYCDELLKRNIKGESFNADKASWKEKLIMATKLKIANILLRNGNRNIYGYTADNMVLKGFPKPNHLIVTMFVENPEEKPETQSVTDIFRNVDSFAILADSDKKDVFNIVNMTDSAIKKCINDEVISEIKAFRNRGLDNFKNAGKDDSINKKEDGKIIDSIWNGISASAKELLDKKVYIIDCINVYFDMVLRIDALGVRCINAMLDVENENRDKKYDRHLNVSHKREVKDNDEKRDSYKEMHDIEKRLNRISK